MRITSILVCSIVVLFGTMVTQERLDQPTQNVTVAHLSAAPDTLPPADFIQVEKEPTVVRKVEPHYPEIALRAGIEGKVWVKIWVDTEGKARDVQLLKSDNPVFDQSAIDAAKQFVFTPAEKDGKRVSVWVSVPFKFKVWDAPADVTRYADELRAKIDRPTVVVVRGPKALKSFIKYPPAAIEKRIEGTVFASVSLTDSLTVSELKISQGLEKTCDRAVLAALSSYDFSVEKDLSATQGGSVSIVVQFLLPAKKK